MLRIGDSYWLLYCFNKLKLEFQVPCWSERVMSLFWEVFDVPQVSLFGEILDCLYLNGPSQAERCVGSRV